MRSDYTLYVVALIFLAITCISIIALEGGFEKNLSVVATAILTLLFAGLGYTQRPSSKTTTIEAPLPPAQPTALVTEIAMQKESEHVEEAPPTRMDVTLVKGIKERRAEQLKALGIGSVEELANASAKDLAARLKISSKFTEKWIENAKELTSKP